MEEALHSYPELKPELEPLLRLSVELRSLPKVQAPQSLRGVKRPAFAPAPSPGPESLTARGLRLLQPALRWTSPMVRIAAGVALVGMLLGGTVVASAGSLPEQPLYPVKRAVEHAQLALTLNPERRAELEMSFASRRLQEVETAVQQGNTQAVQQGLAIYERQVEGALDQSPTAASGDSAEKTQLQASLEKQQETLARVYTQAPPAAQPAILHAMEVSQRGRAHSDKTGSGGDGNEVAPTAPVGTTAVPTPVVPTSSPVATPTNSRDDSSGKGVVAAPSQPTMQERDSERDGGGEKSQRNSNGGRTPRGDKDEGDGENHAAGTQPSIAPTGTALPVPTQDGRGSMPRVESTRGASRPSPTATATPQATRAPLRDSRDDEEDRDVLRADRPTVVPDKGGDGEHSSGDQQGKGSQWGDHSRNDSGTSGTSSRGNGQD